jgi:hypothetical protein
MEPWLLSASNDYGINSGRCNQHVSDTGCRNHGIEREAALFLSVIPIAATSMVLLLLNYFRPTRGFSIASSVVLAVFLGLVSVSLFAYLGRRGQITSGVSMCR